MPPKKTDVLRISAEKKLAKAQKEDPRNLSEIDTLKLIHELEVHQIELEMQNEELSNTNMLYGKLSAKYKNLYDFAPFGYLTLSNEGIILNLNLYIAKLLGRNRVDLLNKQFSVFLSDDSKRSLSSFLERQRLTKITDTVDLELNTNGSDLTYIHVSGYGDNNGDKIYVTALNVTRNRIAEEKLKQSASVWNNTFNAINDSLFILDCNQNILQANIATYLIIGKRPEEVLGMKCHDVMHGLQSSITNCPFHRMMITKHRESLEVNIGDKSYQIIVDPVFNDFGDISGAVHIMSDVTEGNRTLQELKTAKEKAEESDRLKSSFLANMSHEIRTPMNGILGFADLLKNPDLTGENQQEYIGIIESSGERMLALINDLIDISKIEAGLMNVYLSQFNLNEKIDFLYSFFLPQAKQKRLILSFSKGLPDTEAIIQSDEAKVIAILINLIRNALKFTPSGSVVFGYTVRSGMVEFFVQDTGVGVPEEQKAIIFERFRQGNDIISKEYEGSGLGLAISRSFAEMLGGEIWITSPVNEDSEKKGSVFSFNIPYIIGTMNDNQPGQQHSSAESYLTMSGLNILIAEDDKVSMEYLTVICRPIAKKLLFAISGDQAVDITRDNADLDLIFLDIKLPVMDGLAAARGIREFNKNVIIIAQTAFAPYIGKSKAINAGCDDYISKPFSKNNLLAKIHSNLKKRTEK